MSLGKLTGCAPILLVASAKEASRFYHEKLGFKVVQLYDDPINFAILTRDECTLFLSQAKDSKDIVPYHKLVHNMWNVYFYVSDVEAIYDEFKAKNVPIDYGIESKDYGMKEFGIQDLDGYDIAFAEPLNKT